MKSLDFLGGKYQQGEQILPGAIQTFRANDVSAGKPVFIHRVSAEDTTQQLALLRLLSTALLRSATARKMVLDVRDEDGCCYVVTETAHQCLLLREWLKYELDQIENPSVDETVLRPEPALEGTPKVETTPPPPQKEPGEFTRMFQAMSQTPKQERASAPAPVQRPNPAPEPKAAPGEFTQLFNSSALPKPAQNEPPARSVDRPSERFAKTGVQRPNTQTSGEFTKFFSPQRGNSAGAAPKVEPPDFFGAPSESPSFNPVSTKEPGEYTKMFVKSGSQPVPGPPTTPTRPEPSPAAYDDSLLGKPQAKTAPVAAPPPGPSEYTRVLYGNRASENPVAMPPEAAAEPSPAPKPSAAPPAVPQMKMPAAPTTPLQAMHPPVPNPSVQVPQVKPPAVAPIAATAPKAAANPNQKLIILLVALGVLAIVLVMLVVLTLKK